VRSCAHNDDKEVVSITRPFDSHQWCCYCCCRCSYDSPVIPVVIKSAILQPEIHRVSKRRHISLACCSTGTACDNFWHKTYCGGSVRLNDVLLSNVCSLTRRFCSIRGDTENRHQNRKLRLLAYTLYITLQSDTQTLQTYSYPVTSVPLCVVIWDTVYSLQ